jgi:hypothetical protein
MLAAEKSCFTTKLTKNTKRNGDGLSVLPGASSGARNWLRLRRDAVATSVIIDLRFVSGDCAEGAINI